MEVRSSTGQSQANHRLDRDFPTDINISVKIQLSKLFPRIHPTAEVGPILGRDTAFTTQPEQLIITGRQYVAR